ncbi:MAG: T9SS type A sorting domain-containing protein [Cyclobacteriaceae bacterium]
MTSPIIIKSLFFICISYYVSGQTTSSPSLLRSTLSASGSSIVIDSERKIYNIQQSIGQQSSIGTFSNGNYVIRQGFIQPCHISSQKIITPPAVSVVVFPNPFTEFIKLSFDRDIYDEMSIAVYDLRGQLVYEETFKEIGIVKVPLSRIPDGHYLLKVQLNDQRIVEQILKTSR